MDAGKLNDAVTFAQRAVTSDGYGNVMGDWTDQFTVPANIRPRLGGEAVFAARVQGTQPAIIRVRQTTQTLQVTPDWKAVNRAGVEYNVRSIVDPYQHNARRGQWLEMLAEAGGSVG